MSTPGAITTFLNKCEITHDFLINSKYMLLYMKMSFTYFKQNKRTIFLINAIFCQKYCKIFYLFRYGDVHPQVALCQYREYSGNKNVKLVVCGMSATDFTVADKEDPLMLDIVGFDATTPWLISEFARGRL